MMLVRTSLAAMLILGSAASVSAHPPDAVDAAFDLESHVLTVEVEHGTRDAAKHYIDKIEVELNGDKIIEQKFGAQIDGHLQRAIYMIADAAIDDEIKVTAHCNISGKKRASIKIKRPPEPEETDEVREGKG
jgi:desulfoferrodoxin (superoxide reductase-like protein)